MADMAVVRQRVVAVVLALVHDLSMAEVLEIVAEPVAVMELAEKVRACWLKHFRIL